MIYLSNFLHISFTILITLIFIVYRKPIATKFNLIDRPEKDKIHKDATPIIASFGIFFSFLYFYFLEISQGNINIDLIVFLCITMGSFILGLIDDKLKLSYKNKFAILIPLLFICILFSESFIISKYKFEVFKNIYTIENNILSVLITCFFLLLLMNAINLIDGINGLALGIFIIWLGYFNFFLLDNFSLFLNIILISSLITFYFIYKGKYFLGDSGSLFLSSMIGLLIIQEYNLKINSSDVFFVENIFILFMLPGYDMFRVFLFRTLNKKNPFIRSRDHLHDYLIKKLNLFTTLSIFFSYIVIFLFLYHLKIFGNVLLIFLSILTYFIILYISHKKSH